MDAIAVLIIVFFVLMLMLLLYVILRGRKNLQKDAQKVRATLLEKGKYSTGTGDSDTVEYYAIFEFADGTRHKLDFWGPLLHGREFKALRENESGVLTYKEVEGKYIFVGFECNGIQPHEQPPFVGIKRAQNDTQTFEQPAEQPPHTPAPPIPSEPPEPKSKLNLWLACIGLGISLLCMVAALVYFSFESTAGLIASVALVSYLAFGVVRGWVKRKKLQAVPEQKMAAAVAGKEQTRQKTKLYIIFSVPDGTAKRIPVPPGVYTSLVKGDRGVLTFKESKNDAMFIGFDRNGEQI